MSLPIVFIHKGYSSYLEFALRQAKYTNPESDIILLGDESNDRFGFVKHVNNRAYFSEAKEFAGVYRHFSSNPYDYERFCFQRWFVLKEYMQSEGVEDVFVCDSDILVYSNINKVKENGLKGHDCAFMIWNDGDNASAGIAYWTLESLSEFCGLISDGYRDESKRQMLRSYYQRHKIGGVSDMTFAREFYNLNAKKEQSKIYNFLEINDDAVFDNNINLDYVCSEEKYDFRLGAKCFSWKDGIPYCRNLDLDTAVRFHLIHFQGPAKYMMSKYYTGDKFSGQFALSTKYVILNFLAHWYKRLKIRTRLAFLWRN